MKKRLIKKAFTLVELLVVIAILAVLATVSVLGYSAFIKKANQSVDLSAVTQMNNVLQANEVLEGKTIRDAIDALAEAGLDAEDYKPLTADRYFFWDNGSNRIVYAEYNNNKYEVIYPEGYTKVGQWFSLTNEIPEDKTWAGNSTKTSDIYTNINVNSGEQLISVVNSLKNIQNGGEVSGFASRKTIDDKSLYGINQNLVINLTQDIDFGGSSFNINLASGVNFTLNGNNHTLSGISNINGFSVSSQNTDHVISQYGGSIIGYAANSTLLFKDVTIKDSYFGSSDVKGSSIFVGVSVGCNITFENTTVDNCKIEALKGAAIYVGHVQNGVSYTNTISFINNNKTSNSEVISYATASKDTNLVAYVIGRISIGGYKANCILTLAGKPTIENTTLISNGNTISKTVYVVAGSDYIGESMLICDYTDKVVCTNGANQCVSRVDPQN